MLISLTVPVTLPVTLPVKLPCTLATVSSLLKFQRSSALVYVSVALAPSTVIPAPFAAEALPAPLAIVILRSSTASWVLFIVVVVPLTVRLPVTVKSLPIVTSLGKPICTWLFVTAVSISLVVPAKVSVSVPSVIVSVPLSPAISVVVTIVTF